jgi:hypothetical protein
MGSAGGDKVVPGARFGQPPTQRLSFAPLLGALKAA